MRGAADGPRAGDAGELHADAPHRLPEERVEEEEEVPIIEGRREHVTLQKADVVQRQAARAAARRREALLDEVYAAEGGVADERAPQHHAAVTASEVVKDVATLRLQPAKQLAHHLVRRAAVEVDQFVPMLEDELHAVPPLPPPRRADARR